MTAQLRGTGREPVIRFGLVTRRVDRSVVSPLIALPLAAAGLLVPTGRIMTVLTIGNFFSSKRHVAKVEQGGVVVTAHASVLTS